MKIFDKNYQLDYHNVDVEFMIDRRGYLKRHLKKCLSKARRRISKLFLKKETKYE